MENQKQRVYDALNKMGIKYEVVEHEPVHTMEDMDRLGLPAKGTLCKNLFLRDAKGKRHFLVTADENAKVDLNSVPFGDEGYAMACLDFVDETRAALEEAKKHWEYILGAGEKYVKPAREEADIILNGDTNLAYFSQILEYIYTITNNFTV